jgi:glycosyltransferase involved in cell wall biosynthesis
MGKIKVFALPSHTTEDHVTGVDFARIIQPMKALNGKFDVETTIYNPDEEVKHNDPLEWDSVMKDIDIFYFNYLNNPWGFAALGMMARKYGVKLVMDLDDSLWNIRSDNPAFKVYNKGSKALQDFTSICNEVDYITTTNTYLRNVIMQNTNKNADKIEIFPNYIDLSMYKHRKKEIDNGKITLLHFGSTTHFMDLKDDEFVKGVDKIMKEYPNVEFKTIGAFIPEFKKRWGMRYEQIYGHTNIYNWIQDKDKFPKMMDMADILVTPLDDDIYNRCKSHIKWLEASSAKLPGVWQAIRQYNDVVDGTNGLTARKSNEWYDAIKFLIDNPDKRKAMGEKAFQDVSDNWQIQDNVKDYADFFKSILSS